MPVFIMMLGITSTVGLPLHQPLCAEPLCPYFMEKGNKRTDMRVLNTETEVDSIATSPTHTDECTVFGALQLCIHHILS